MTAPLISITFCLLVFMTLRRKTSLGLVLLIACKATRLHSLSGGALSLKGEELGFVLFAQIRLCRWRVDLCLV